MDQNHYEAIDKRWVHLEKRMQTKTQGLFFDRRAEQRLLEQAIKASSAKQALIWIRRAADKLSESLMDVAACRAGCSHCCNIGVAVSKSEALAISKATGRALNPHAGLTFEKDGSVRDAMSRNAYGMPCTFLQEGRCSIYADRPQACRLQVNMDDDDLLCKLVDWDKAPRVPYADTRNHIAVAMMKLDQCHDDLRNWFSDPNEPLPVAKD